MDEVQKFVSSLKKQVINLIAAQFLVIIGAAIAFYFNTQNFKDHQRELNTTQEAFNNEIRDKVDEKVSVNMVIQLQTEYNTRQERIEKKLDEFIFTRLK